jgi:hypothetical protein
MAERSNSMTKTVIAADAPRIKRRCAELFCDSRFKPRIVKSKTVYSRKGRTSKDQNHAGN